MIKSLSSYYINTSFVSLLSGATCSSYTISLYVWNGGKTNAPTSPTYQITKENPTSSTGVDSVNIARLVNDFVNLRPRSAASTEAISADNQYWLKHSVVYTTTDADDLNVDQNITVDLLGKGYGYGMEGLNPTTPTDKILLQGREFNVNRGGVFVAPILIDEITSTLAAVNETIEIYHQTTILNILGNDDLGFEPTNISSISTAMPSNVGALEISNNTVIFTAGTILTTPQTFIYSITDSVGGTSTATVTLNISAAPATITAVTDLLYADNLGDETFDVLDNDTLGTTPTNIVSISQTEISTGALAISGDSLLFIPNGDAAYSFEPFTYTIEDSTTAQSTTTSYLYVNSAAIYNKHLLKVTNSSTSNTLIEGRYADNGETFYILVPANSYVDVNRCVIESSLTLNIDITYSFTSC